MTRVQERNRFTCVLNLYHEQTGEQPAGVRLAFSDTLQYSVQRYMRHYAVDQEPKPLDLGWFRPEQVGFILIENLEGIHSQTLPSDEELAAINVRVIEVCYGESMLIPPRRFLPFFFAHPERATVCCPSGKAKMGITVYPR